jgi:2-polyprenyl-3-methyl-5-hydroxy-6-metoxy-1,4-benzoquinol methylase
MTQYSESYYAVAARKPNRLRRLARSLNLTPLVPGFGALVTAAPPGSRALDVGCGVGDLLEALERLNPRLQAVGIDLGTPPRASAAAFLRGHAERLPLRSGEFRIVSCSHVLEHSRDAYAIVAELARVCMAGGAVYLETPSGRAASLPFGTFWDDATHVRPYSPQALSQLLEAHGLTVTARGHKYSWVAALFGLPYMIVGTLLGDARARWLWPTYTFGLNAYALAVKPMPEAHG